MSVRPAPAAFFFKLLVAASTTAVEINASSNLAVLLWKIFNNLDLVLNTKEIVCGLFTYVISRNGICKLFKTAKSNDIDTDVPSMFMEIADLNKEYVSLSESEKNKNIRLTLDYEDDLQFFRKLFQNIGILVTGNDIIIGKISPNLVKSYTTGKPFDCSKTIRACCITGASITFRFGVLEKWAILDIFVNFRKIPDFISLNSTHQVPWF